MLILNIKLNNKIQNLFMNNKKISFYLFYLFILDSMSAILIV